MKQKISKGSSPTKQNIQSKNAQDMVSLLRGQSTILDIPVECQKELESKGLEGRWIDVIQLQKNQGWHKKEWQPYKFACKLASAANPFGGQAGAFDGYLVRQQLVLAAKPVEKAELERAKVKLKTQLQSDPEKLKVQEMREMVRQAGVDAKVLDADGDED